MCLMKTIYSRFKDCGMVELLSEVGVGNEGTIRTSMNGGDFKEGIRYYQILFEAFLRTKLNKMNFTNEHSLDEAISNVQKDLNPQNASSVLNNLSTSVLTEQEGSMSKWIESFIDMVGLLLSVIRFQRT